MKKALSVSEQIVRVEVSEESPLDSLLIPAMRRLRNDIKNNPGALRARAVASARLGMEACARMATENKEANRVN